MGKVRVGQLAKELNIKVSEVIARLKEPGAPVPPGVTLPTVPPPAPKPAAVAPHETAAPAAKAAPPSARTFSTVPGAAIPRPVPGVTPRPGTVVRPGVSSPPRPAGTVSATP